jgi:hypothetical protein
MTKAQKFRFYFPAWTACCRANGWKMQQGRLLYDASQLTEEGRKVLAFAMQRAVTEHRPVNVDDMRHAAHIVAIGRDKSSEHLTNDEVDRVVTLFQLLTDPEDLGYRMKWDAYQRGEDPGVVTRLDWSIRHAAPDAYVRAIAHGKFGTRAWENLTVGQKQHLAMTLAQRRKKFHQPINRGGTEARRTEPELSAANAPF